jgi:hypothetical protein
MEALSRAADGELYGMKSQQEKHAPLQFAAAAKSRRRSGSCGGFTERRD